MTTHSLSIVGKTQSRDKVWKIILGDQTQAGTRGVRAQRIEGAHFFNNENALRILRHGVSSKVIAPLSQHFDLGKGELVEILDLDRTTATRRASKDQPLPLHSAENVLRLLELEEMANDTFDSEESALGWLRRSHPMLENETPLESAKTSFGARRAKDILVAIKYGGAV